MPTFNDNMYKKLIIRKEISNYRELTLHDYEIDFSSNDYLGIAKTNNTGSTGSRLISGNYNEIEKLENDFSVFVGSERSLFYNSGYQANVGIIPALSDRNTTIIYDEFIHASLRDGIRLSYSKNYSFVHNDLNNLKGKLERANGLILIVVESVYSMEQVHKRTICF